MTLDEVPPGQDVTVLASRADTVRVTRRLAELGIRAGSLVHVQSRTSGGGAILAVGDDRIAASRVILRGVTVVDPAAAHG